ncbi:MerR family transcriptional regulator [Dinoroseobacter sp. S375]|uniref:MerR family transcriptional regulator n=1 Tax=Dinoroseobacter sp. S375 TaxID=3415136 RepID=UPI003C7D1334
MEKSADAFRTISEVADWLGVPTHVLRFWESKFSQVKPVKRAGGRRYYRPNDMALLAGIRVLLHDDGMTIRGVQKLLREKGAKHVAERCDRSLTEAPAAPEPTAPEPAAQAPAPDDTVVELSASTFATPDNAPAEPAAESEPLPLFSSRAAPAPAKPTLPGASPQAPSGLSKVAAQLRAAPPTAKAVTREQAQQSVSALLALKARLSGGHADAETG